MDIISRTKNYKQNSYFLCETCSLPYCYLPLEGNLNDFLHEKSLFSLEDPEEVMWLCSRIRAGLRWQGPLGKSSCSRVKNTLGKVDFRPCFRSPCSSFWGELSCSLWTKHLNWMISGLILYCPSHHHGSWLNICSFYYEGLHSYSR